MEYFTAEGICTKYVCPGHVDHENFRYNCGYFFGAESLQKVFHGFMRAKRVEVENGLDYTTMEQCSSEAKDKLKITIGIP